MDTITKHFLTEFSTNNNCKQLSEDNAFEAFSNFCIINKILGSSNFDIFSISTGDNAQGIDGIAIIVNNKICTTVKEIQDLIEWNSFLDVDFVLIQAKTSPNFNNTKILNFLHFVKHFFELEKETSFKTTEMKNFLELRDFIFENANLFSRRNPKCYLYYCSLGTWQGEETLIQLIESNKLELLQNIAFSDLIFQPVDAREIQDLYRKTKSPVEAKFKFEHRVYLPPIRDVETSLSGLIPFNEFKKIIVDDLDQIKPVFEDNIRDYLLSDSNTVNSDICQTIKSSDFDYFSILNNGITIVAESIAGASNEITIKNYQIVNGCQTSHVLYENKDVPGIEQINVPVKIIVTNNNDIKSKITRATNNQTQVGVDQLEALTEFQKRLELYYEAKVTPDDYKLFYERRTNQHYKKAPKFRIVSIEVQLKSFAAMFRDGPHLVQGHYGKLLKQMGDEIFKDSDCLNIYYISSLSYFVMEQMYQKGYLNKDYWKYRYHILTIFRYLASNENIPPMNSNKKITNYSKIFEDILTNEIKSSEFFKLAESILTNKDNGLRLDDRKCPERKNDTETLIQFILEMKPENKQQIVEINKQDEPYNLCLF